MEQGKVDCLLKARAEIDEELLRSRTPVTILFTDVVGSTAYFDRHGDTAGFILLQRHAELASNAILAFGGKIIKTIGDSVMAEFPEPASAVRSAVEIQRRTEGLNQSLPMRERLQLRVGIHHGPAFRQSGDVYGDTINRAARITKHTAPEQILISRSVRDGALPAADFRCICRRRMTLEGKRQKEDVFEVIWTERETGRNQLGGEILASLAMVAVVAVVLVTAAFRLNVPWPRQWPPTGGSPPAALSDRPASVRPRAIVIETDNRWSYSEMIRLEPYLSEIAGKIKSKDDDDDDEGDKKRKNRRRSGRKAKDD